MAAKSLAERVAALEAQVGGKTIQEQLREQAELIDELLAQRFQALEGRWNPRFAKMEGTIGTLQTDVATLKTDVATLKTDVKSLQRDMVIVREGISILLERRPPQ